MSKLSTEMLKDWLETQVHLTDNEIEIVSGRMPDMPDRAISIVRGSGRGETLDGAFERVSYLTESRGGPNNLEDAEYIATLLDSIIIQALYSVTMDDVQVLFAEWTSGGPQQQIINDSQSRYVYVCNYTVESSKE